MNLPGTPGGHADSFTVTIMLHLRPEAVRTDRITSSRHLPIDWCDPQLDLSRYSPSGVVGDPTRASAKLGERLWKAVIVEVAKMLRTVTQSALSP